MWLSSWRCWWQICGTVAVFTFCPVFLCFRRSSYPLLLPSTLLCGPWPFFLPGLPSLPLTNLGLLLLFLLHSNDWVNIPPLTPPNDLIANPNLTDFFLASLHALPPTLHPPFPPWPAVLSLQCPHVCFIKMQAPFLSSSFNVLRVWMVLILPGIFWNSSWKYITVIVII